jgi:hypothetical protein
VLDEINRKMLAPTRSCKRLGWPTITSTVASVIEKSREIGTVSKPYQNPIPNNDWSYRSSEEQIPQIVENNKNGVEIWEPREAHYSLHTQEVAGSRWNEKAGFRGMR